MEKLKDAKFNKVGLAFSSDFSQLELAWVNTQTGDIIQAGHTPLACINPNTRVIEDPDSLRESILSLYDLLGVPTELHATVILPSLYTRMIPFPASLNDDEMAMALTSEVERSVLFKRNVPQVDWIKLNETEDGTLQVLLSSYPASEIDTLIGCLEPLKLPIVGIDTHLTSLLRGLHSTGTIPQDRERRLLCVVSVSNFAILVLEGTTILTLVEVPLSTQGGTEEQLLADLDQDLLGLGDYLFDCVQAIVVKNTDAVTIEGLARSFSRFSDVILVEQSVDTIASLGSETPMYPCSVEVLGASLFESLKEVPRFNFLPLEKQTLTCLKEARQKALLVMVGLNVVACAIVGCVLAAFMLGNTLKGNELSTLEKDVEKNATVKIDQNHLLENLWLNKNLDHNRSILTWLIDIEKKLPPASWFKSLDVAFTSGDAQLTVMGGSQGSNEITAYRQALKPSFISTDVKSKIEPAEFSVEDDTAVVSSTAGTDPASPTTVQPPATGTTEATTPPLNYYAWTVTAGTPPAAAGAAATAPVAATPPAAPTEPPAA